MAIPSINLTLPQNSLGFSSDSAGKNILLIGPGISGVTSAVGEIQAVNSPIKSVSLFGYSPLSEIAAFCSNLSPSNTYAMEIPAIKTQLSSQAMTKSGTGPAITVDGYALNDFELVVKIISASKFAYSLDAGRTYSQERALVTGAFVIANSGLTITFASGTFVANDYYTYNCVGYKLDSSYTDEAFLAIKADSRLFGSVVFYDGTTLASTANTRFGLLKTELLAAQSQKTFMRSLIDFGSKESSAATVVTAANLIDCDQIGIVCDSAQIQTALNREGYTYPKLGLIVAVAGRTSQALISEDLGQVNKGALVGVQALANDQSSNSNGLDAAKIITGMKYKGRSGAYVTNSHLKSVVGSDYKYLQHGRIMDTALTILCAKMPEFLKAPLATVSGGYISSADAIRIEQALKAVLNDALLTPANSSNFAGHVSALEVAVDKTQNLITTETIYLTVYLRPFGYANVISATVGFSLK